MRPALGLCAVALTMTAAGSRPAAAQLYQPLAQRTLLTTDVRDERAVWVNPAGLSRRPLASVAADLTAERTAGELRLAQYGLSFASRTIGFGWKHDRYPGGTGGDTYVLGLGLGDDAFSGGFAHRWNHRAQGSWDVALRARATPTIDVSLVWRNIGSPVVRDSVYRDAFVPAAALRLFGDRLLAGVEGDVSGDLGSLRDVRAGATLTLFSLVSVSCRGTFSRDAARREIALRVELGGPTYRGTVATLFPSGGGLGAVGASGALLADLPGSRRR